MKITKEIKGLPWPEPWSSQNERVHVLVTVETKTIGHERLLMLDFLINRKHVFFNNGPQDFRVVASRKRKDYIVVERSGKSGRWPLGEVMKRKGYYITPRTCYPEISEADEETLRRWLRKSSTRNHQLDNLTDWMTAAAEQQKAQEEADKEAQRRARGELVKDDVGLCPAELPAGMEAWLREKVLAKDRTLVYKRGNVRGICYKCGQHVQADPGQRFRQGEVATCPNCQEPVVCQLETAGKFKVDYVQNVIAAQKGTDGQTVFFRQWHLLRDPEAKYEHIEDWLEEFGRYAARGYTVMKWLHEYKENYYMNTFRYKLDAWELFKGAEIYDGPYEFFGGSLPAAVEGTRLQYADVMGYYKTANKDHADAGYGYHNVVRYALDWTRYPVMEFLWKAGYKQVVFRRVAGMSKEEKNAIRWTRRTLKECFKFPLPWLKMEKPGAWTMEKIARANTLAELLAEGHIVERDIKELLGIGANVRMLADAAGRYAPTMKIIKYLGKQTENHAYGLEREYRDYIADCEKLGLDLTDKQVLFPRDLRDAHNRTAAMVQHKRSEERQAAFMAQVEKLEKWAWERDGLLVRPARSQEELIEEGHALHHCVGGYVAQMAEGKSAIFFVRKAEEPDRPFFTLELEGTHMVQCRTSNNEGYRNHPEIAAFVDAWVEKVVKKSKKTRKQSKQASAA